MKKRTFLMVPATLLFFTLIFAPAVSDGFYDNAHRILSLRAINPNLTNASNLHGFLRSTLRFEFPQGIFEPVAGRDSVAALISDGAVREDYPESRVLNHFHDPTRAWNVAGFKGTGLSSIVWSQLPFQQVGITRGWKTARDAYFRALTGTSSSQRKQWYAETFRTLGHLIHHVQDAAVPAHTRDDSHLTILNLDSDPFHAWADSSAGLSGINQSQPLKFGSTLLNQANPNPDAPIPFARITDSTDGNIGTLALGAGLTIGLAEYSNANFISRGTALSLAYQSPRLSQLDFSTVTQLPNGTRVRYAKFRPGFGERDYMVGVSSRMVLFVNNTTVPDALDLGLDDNVHEDYGRKLFPRAIGYSAGLIDYFFRGNVDATPVPFPDYVLTPFSARPNSIRVDNVSVKVDGTNEQAGSGTLRLVLLYSVKFGGSFPDGPPVVVSHEVPYGGGTQSVVFPFDSLPFPTSYPAGSGSHIYQYSGLVVYKGPLGQETEAVVPGNQCTDPSDGAKYVRWYQLEHCVPGLWFPEEDCAYIQYGC